MLTRVHSPIVYYALSFLLFSLQPEVIKLNLFTSFFYFEATLYPVAIRLLCGV